MTILFLLIGLANCRPAGRNNDNPGSFNDTVNTYAIVTTPSGSFIAIDQQKNVLCEVFPYDNGPDYTSDGLFRIIGNGKIGYADSVTGKIVIPPQFDCAWPFEDGVAKVSTDCKTQSDGEHTIWLSDHWFYIDKNGKKVEKLRGINIGSWILSFVVLLLIFLSGYMMRNSVRLLLTGKRAQGTVVEMYSSTSITSEPEKTPMQTPLVEFVTSEGEPVRVTGRSYSLKPSAQIGDVLKIAYSKSNPKDAQLLILREFPLGPAGFLLGFAVILILMWIAGILISGDSKWDDPFHLLPALISHFHLNPFRFPMILILSMVIPACMLGTWQTSKRAINLLTNGIKTAGYVIGSERVYSESNDGTVGSGVFPVITYKDESGKSYNIHGSSAKVLSRLNPGDQVEVIYPADSPNRGVLNKWSEFWIPPIFFGFMTAALLVLAFLVVSGYKGIVT
jgi:hypothetical protein